MTTTHQHYDRKSAPDDSTDDESAVRLVCRELGAEECRNEDGDIVGVVYYADETSTYYAVTIADCRDYRDIRRAGTQSAYSHWCAGSTPEGEGETANDAAEAAGWTI